MMNQDSQTPVKQDLSHWKGLFRQSLRWPLLIAISGNILLTLLIIGLGLFSFIANAEQRSWQVRQAENAREASSIIESFITSKQSQLVLISLPQFGKITQGPDALDDFIQRDNAWLEIVRLNNKAEPVAGGYADQPMLQNMFTTKQSYWYLTARNGNKYLGSVQISADDTPYLILSVPAVEGGVVSGRLRMNVLWDVVSKIRFGETGIAYIVNKEDGRIIAYPDQSIVLRNQSISESPLFQLIWSKTGTEWNGNFRSFQGVMVQTNAVQIPETNWVVVTEVNLSEVTQTRSLALRISAAGLLFLWLLMTVTTNAYLERMILRPIENLRQGADRIGQGDLEHRIPIHQQDEIGRVTEQFNRMTSELADREQMLVRARDKAVVDSQFKTELLAKVSHDLRTPLGVILGFAEMVRDGIFGSINERQKQPIGEIINGANQLSGMVSELLDSARLESHTLRLRIDKIDPRQLMRQVRGQLSMLAERKGLILATEIEPDLPEAVDGDANRLHQIINNLAGNAIKFTQRGCVTIRMYRFDADTWAISVTDTGPGIPPDALAYIFEPFRQVNDSGTRDKGGVGLGLSIVQQLVQLMDGQVTVESILGRGSIFTVVLPFSIPSKKEE